MTERIVFAWSGSADAWANIAATATARAAEIVTLTLDLGQGADLEEVRDRALACGAVRAHVLDVREEFARDYVLPALHAQTLAADPIGRALATHLAARKLEEVAAMERATPAADSVAVDGTLLGRVATAYTLTTAPAAAPSSSAQVEIAFERGVPVAINGISMPLTELIEILTIIGGHHGVGRLDRIEAPAAVILIAAYRQLANGDALDAVSGTVRIELLKGEHTVVRPS